MDTPTDSIGALDENQAANLFAQILDPSAKQDKAEPEKKEQQPQAKAEDAPEATQDAPAEEAPQDDDPLVKIVVDGQELEVKTSELKRAYGKEAASHKRFDEAAQVRKQADEETSKARETRQQYAQNLQRMQVQLEASLADQQQNVNWEQLLASDPVEYLKQERLARQRQATLQQVQAEQGKVASQIQAEQQISLSKHLESQQQLLLQKLPEWKTGDQAKAERTAIREYLLKEGYGQSEVENVHDAKAVLLARKAMLYDQMMSKANAAAKKVATLPTKVERPGTGESPGLDRRGQAFQRLSKSGRVEDAAAVFASLL